MLVSFICDIQAILITITVLSCCSYLCYLFLHSLAKKLKNSIRVPLVYAQRLHNMSLVIHQFDKWV